MTSRWSRLMTSQWSRLMTSRCSKLSRAVRREMFVRSRGPPSLCYIFACVLVTVVFIRVHRARRGISAPAAVTAPREARLVMHRSRRRRGPSYNTAAELALSLNISMETYTNVFHNTDVLREVNQAVKGDLFHPLPNFKNPCWMSEYSSYTKKYYSKDRNKFLDKELGYDFLKAGDRLEERLNNFTAKVRRRLSQGLKSRLRCLPYAYIIGVSKGGTTDLAVQLTRHPDVAAPLIKETFWWGLHRLRQDGYDFSSYLDTFDAVADEIEMSPPGGQRAQHSEAYHNKITFEATSTYLYQYIGDLSVIPGNLNLPVPWYLVADSIHAIQPHGKLIVLVREPGDRLFSNFRMTASRGLTPGLQGLDAGSLPAAFHESVVKFVNLMTECFQTRGAAACAYDVNLDKDNELGFVVRSSFYHVHLADWLKRFPRQQLLILRSEDYFRDRETALLQVYSHLGLDVPPGDGIKNHTTSGAANSNFFQGGKMYKKTRDLLTRFFAPYNQQLASLLGDHRFLWHDMIYKTI